MQWPCFNDTLVKQHEYDSNVEYIHTGWASSNEHISFLNNCNTRVLLLQIYFYSEWIVHLWWENDQNYSSPCMNERLIIENLNVYIALTVINYSSVSQTWISAVTVFNTPILISFESSPYFRTTGNIPGFIFSMKLMFHGNIVMNIKWCPTARYDVHSQSARGLASF